MAFIGKTLSEEYAATERDQRLINAYFFIGTIVPSENLAKNAIVANVLKGGSNLQNLKPVVSTRVGVGQFGLALINGDYNAIIEMGQLKQLLILLPVFVFFLIFLPMAIVSNQKGDFSPAKVYNVMLTKAKEQLSAKSPFEFSKMMPGSKWIVVTSIQYPTEDVKRLAAQEGWNVVVVADKKTPNDWNLDGVHFLSIENQTSLGEFAKMLPFNSYTRKNLGYLYAIMKGAEYIYDTDDDNKPYAKGLDQFDYTPTISGIRYIPRGGNISEKLFNPYQFYGFKNMWPRGFPLEYLEAHSNGKNRMISCRKMKTPAVQQGVVHNDPDVDAIYRLLYADRKTGLSAEFNSAAPPIVLDEGTYSPWNSQNTLFHYRAFFTMFLPSTVAFRVTDIWRSYFAQKMLHLVGEQVAFYPVNAVQFRNAHSFLKDFEQELDVYEKSGKIVEFLDQFTCSTEITAECVMQLADEFARQEFFGKEDRDMMEAWIQVLQEIGYEFPPLDQSTAPIYRDTGKKLDNCRAVNLDLGLAVYSWNKEPDYSWATSAINHFGEVLTWCEKAAQSMGATYDTYLPSPEEFSSLYVEKTGLYNKKDSVLVLLNNYPWKSAVGLLQRLYSPFFKVLIFCGSWDPDSIRKEELNVYDPINYINISPEEMSNGYYYNYCVSKVRDLRLQNVTGYYFVADDSLFNVWHNLPLDTIVNPNGLNPAFTDWFNSKSIVKMVDLVATKYKDDEEVQSAWKEYDIRLKEKGTNISLEEHMKKFTGKLVSDFVYLPTKEMNFFATMFEITTEAEVFVEIAYAKMDNVIKRVKGGNFTYLWLDRSEALKKFNKNIYGMHPVKMSALESNKRIRKGFCDKMVRIFADEIYRKGSANETES